MKALRVLLILGLAATMPVVSHAGGDDARCDAERMCQRANQAASSARKSEDGGCLAPAFSGAFRQCQEALSCQRRLAVTTSQEADEKAAKAIQESNGIVQNDLGVAQKNVNAADAKFNIMTPKADLRMAGFDHLGAAQHLQSEKAGGELALQAISKLIPECKMVYAEERGQIQERVGRVDEDIQKETQASRDAQSKADDFEKIASGALSQMQSHFGGLAQSAVAHSFAGQQGHGASPDADTNSDTNASSDNASSGTDSSATNTADASSARAPNAGGTSALGAGALSGFQQGGGGGGKSGGSSGGGSWGAPSYNPTPSSWGLASTDSSSGTGSVLSGTSLSGNAESFSNSSVGTSPLVPSSANALSGRGLASLEGDSKLGDRSAKETLKSEEVLNSVNHIKGDATPGAKLSGDTAVSTSSTGGDKEDPKSKDGKYSDLSTASIDGSASNGASGPVNQGYFVGGSKYLSEKQCLKDGRCRIVRRPLECVYRDRLRQECRNFAKVQVRRSRSLTSPSLGTVPVSTETRETRRYQITNDPRISND